jgi:non-specific serine/threonine protein kinase
MIGKTISHYQIIEKLGEGGMGEVYLAEDTDLHRKIAIKFLPQHLTKDKENVERFRREAQAAASLNHPNIVTIHEISHDDDQIFIVMEYVEGKSLRDVINEYKLGLEKTVDIISQICDGLLQAHQAGIVHRDIKLENILIDKDARVKILDFGLAKLKGVSKLTKDSSTVGTIHYMSPEQLRGEEVDHRSDIWSLGVVFYEMLAGEVPFKGDYDQAVAYSIQSEKFEPIKSIAPEHDEMLNKLLAKEPENRYQSLEEIIDALGENKGSKEKRKVSKRHRNFVYPIAIIALIIVGYLLITEVNFDVSKDSWKEWENSIAVLPLKDLSSEGDQEWFCEGMAEQITSNLKMLSKVKAISRTSVMKYKNTDLSIPEIGKELNVEHVLEGSVGKIGGHVRVTVQLINASDDSQIWSKKYDKEYQKLFALQDEISESIAENLIRKISGKELERVKQNKPKSLHAWDYLSRGRYFRTKFMGNPSRLEYFIKSEEMLKKAIELNPDFAPSYAALADLYNTYYNNTASRRTEDEKQKYLELQEKYIEAGLKVDPQAADLHSVKGHYLQAKGDLHGAYDSFVKSLKIDPHTDAGNYAIGLLYGSRGFCQAAIKFLTRAIEINPLYIYAYDARGANYASLGDLNPAIADAEKSLEIAPDFLSGLWRYSWYLMQSNRVSEAEEIIKRLEDLSPNDKRINLPNSILHALRGEKEKAFKIYPEGNFFIFRILKMTYETIDYLRNQIEQHKKWERSIYLELSNSRLYDFLRDDPRFQEILEEEKKLYDELLEKYPDIDI